MILSNHQKAALKRNHNVEWVECISCKRQFPRSNRPRRRAPSGVRPHKCSTCCKHCARRLSYKTQEERKK